MLPRQTNTTRMGTDSMMTVKAGDFGVAEGFDSLPETRGSVEEAAATGRRSESSESRRSQGKTKRATVPDIARR